MTLLASRLEEVNAMALAGDLPDVDISDKGVKITSRENGVPENFLWNRINRHQHYRHIHQCTSYQVPPIRC